MADTQTTKRNEMQLTVEPGKLDFLVTREFDAPREMVFEAYTDPGLVIQWLGPRRLTMRMETFEPWSGGRWRYIFTDKDGSEYVIHGVKHEIRAPERMIETFEFEGLPEAGHVSLETARFEELPGGRTRVTSQSVFQSVEDRDGHLQAGMADGARESYERLDELLIRMQEGE